MKIIKATAITLQYESKNVMTKTSTAVYIMAALIMFSSPIRRVSGSNSTICAKAPIIAPPVMAIAISEGVNPSLRSKYKLKNDSNEARPNDAIKITRKAMKNIGVNKRLKLLVVTSVLSAATSVTFLGSVSINIDKIPPIRPRAAATKNGSRVLISASTPPIPGPIIKPKFIAAVI